MRAVSGDDVDICLLTDDVDGVQWVIPMIVRPLPSALGLSASDCVSPYGFGGPYCSTPGTEATSFLNRVEAWIRESNYCSGFIRLDVGLNAPTGPLSKAAEIVDIAPVVSVDLTRSPNERWSNYEAKVRKNVRRATSSGCRAELVDAETHFNEFVEIYRATMERRNADSFYFFPSARLREFVTRAPGQVDLWLVYSPSGQAVSVELVLVSDESVYSFLGGTRVEAFPMRPNDLLKHQVCEHYSAIGKRRYLLGGGFQAGDGIFKYKKSFDPSGVNCFRGARVEGAKDQYALAVERHLAIRSPGPDANYFPPYRGAS